MTQEAKQNRDEGKRHPFAKPRKTKKERRREKKREEEWVMKQSAST